LVINGWINLDKPAGVTSTDMVTAVKRALNAAKAGHAGTLDPLATGILPIALGEATKVLPYVTDSLKTYDFTITWGQARDTDDAEGKILAETPARPTEASIRAALPAFIGDIMQIPPKYSALKINGERAYDLARAGVDFTLPPRPVYIESLDLLATTPDTARLVCTCGPGTYVRGIARDLAQKLGTLGFITALRRTRVGCFHEQTAISLDKLRENALEQAPHTIVLPLARALDDIPALTFTPTEAARIQSGNALDWVARTDVARLIAAGLDPQITNDTLALGQNQAGETLALLSVTGPKISTVRVFNRKGET
jgi:tRNA pseudouridine55 synthase